MKRNVRFGQHGVDDEHILKLTGQLRHGDYTPTLMRQSRHRVARWKFPLSIPAPCLLFAHSGIGGKAMWSADKSQFAKARPRERHVELQVTDASAGNGNVETTAARSMGGWMSCGELLRTWT